MQFKDDWNIDSLVDFSFYVENLHNQSTVKRTWLIGKIKEELATSEKGVFLTAEMGYGKSSIVSNIVCADKTSDWYGLRRHVLAYHFCRYDSIRSKNAAYFIRNIASAIVKHYPELGNLILSDDIASDILYGLRCSEDPIPCLENAILNPLQNKWKNYQFIIVIDALDECDSADKNNILQLLFKEIDNFPPNIKFIFTSRNIERVLSKFKGLNFITLSSFSNENGKDITEFIEKISHFTKSQLTLITNVAQGNFLLVKLYLESCEKYQHCDFRNIPSSLENIYQMNFERAFDTQSSLFEELRPIFEVLCTMTKPMKEEQILKVANISPDKRRKTERMIGNELGHFIITTNGYLSFLHKSIPDFLTCGSRKHLRFFVDKENGYKLFGAYLLNLPYFSKSDLVDVVHHVAMSRNDDWKTILIQNYSKQILNFTNLPFLFYLHEAVTDFNSYATTNLLLKIMQYINHTDDRNMSAAFLAASHGNEQALKCLLDYGADPYFKVVFPYTKNRRLLTDIVHKCKYIYFCGYNILHIASQNGHIQVVKMLVERFDDVILFTRNDMNLTAFDLAAENGHIEIAAYLLRKNTSFANFISLHHAAENGHSSIVRLLLQYGMMDTCVPCNGSILWIPKSHGRKQQDFRIKYANLTEVKHISFYDDWYLITCDTALNAAVRNGHMDVVKLLLNEETNTLKCTAFDGKTPIMTAVQYNQNTVVRLLLNFKVDFTARCRNEYFPKRRALYSLSKSEINHLTRERCTNGMSIVHLLVMHWNFDTFDQLFDSGLYLYMSDRDNDHSTPLHYAFCHSNYDFVFIAMHLNLTLTIRSKNGSTPFHSGAICKSLILQKVMCNHTIPDVKDIHGLSILQYGSLLKYSNDCLSGTENKNGHFHDIFRVALDSKHNLYHTDVSGRNFLHYAATNGNYFSIVYLLQSFAADINILLCHKDNSGHTPVDILFTSMSKRKIHDPIKVPINCSLISFFYSMCELTQIEIMTPHEIFINLVFTVFKEFKCLQQMNITNYLTLSIHKRRLYPLFILNVFAEDEVEKAVTTISEIYDFLAEFDVQNVPKIKLSRENAINCNGKISPLHKILQNDRGKFWIYSNKDSLSTVLNDYLAKHLDFCVDDKGYNVLQRAAMGGNIAAVKYLIEKGMDVTVLSKKGYNLLHLGLLGAPVSKYDRMPLYYHDSNHFLLIQDILTTGNVTRDVSTVDYSETLGYILNVMFELSNTDLAMLKNQLCQSQKEKLGLLHLAAAKGFLKFLSLCKNLFGVSILNCRDSNDINPYYLAHIYNHDHITEWLDILGVQMILPSPEVESILLYNIVVNYKIRQQVHFTCRLHYRFKHMHIFRHVFERCAKFNKHYVFLSNPAFTKVIKEQRTFLNMHSSWNRNVFYTFPHNFKYCLTKFNKWCSKVAAVLTAGMRMEKKVMRQFERRLRIIMTFGINDELLFFQSIFKCHNVRPGYVESLSFLGLFKHHYRYTELLSVRRDIHSLWLDSYVTKLQKNGVDLKQMSLRFYEESGKNFSSNISKIVEIFKDDLKKVTSSN